MAHKDEGRAKKHFDAGTKFLHGEQYEEALAELRSALSIYRETSDTGWKPASCLFRIGQTLRAMRRYEEALAAYQQAVNIYRDLGYAKDEYADCLHGTGETLIALGRRQEARAAYEQAVRLYDALPKWARELRQDNYRSCLRGMGRTVSATDGQGPGTLGAVAPGPRPTQ